MAAGSCTKTRRRIMDRLLLVLVALSLIFSQEPGKVLGVKVDSSRCEKGVLHRRDKEKLPAVAASSRKATRGSGPPNPTPQIVSSKNSSFVSFSSSGMASTPDRRHDNNSSELAAPQLGSTNATSPLDSGGPPLGEASAPQPSEPPAQALSLILLADGLRAMRATELPQDKRTLLILVGLNLLVLSCALFAAFLLCTGKIRLRRSTADDELVPSSLDAANLIMQVDNMQAEEALARDDDVTSTDVSTAAQASPNSNTTNTSGNLPSPKKQPSQRSGQQQPQGGPQGERRVAGSRHANFADELSEVREYDASNSKDSPSYFQRPNRGSQTTVRSTQTGTPAIRLALPVGRKGSFESQLEAARARSEAAGGEIHVHAPQPSQADFHCEPSPRYEDKKERSPSPRSMAQRTSRRTLSPPQSLSPSVRQEEFAKDSEATGTHSGGKMSTTLSTSSLKSLSPEEFAKAMSRHKKTSVPLGATNSDESRFTAHSTLNSELWSPSPNHHGSTGSRSPGNRGQMGGSNNSPQSATNFKHEG